MNAFSDAGAPKRPELLILVSGILTSATALLLEFALGAISERAQIMALYLNHFIPVGAIALGLLAGSGYGLATRRCGVKISRGLLWTMAGLQIVTYFIAQYLMYRAEAPCYEDGTSVGFFAYYDYMARSFSWIQGNGSPGAPLGIWGYALRLLEVAGFALGSIIAPAKSLANPLFRERLGALN